MSLEGKVAIITGSGGKGTGRAVARRFAQEGMAVVGQRYQPYGAETKTVELIEAAGGRAAFHPADMKNENHIHGLIAFAESTFGGLDIVVNNASQPDTMGLLTGLDDAMAVEILAPMRTTLAPRSHAAPRRRGHCNIASTSALGHGRKHSPWPAYDVGKMAQIRLTTTLACLRDQENIRVNAWFPGGLPRPAPSQYWESVSRQRNVARGVVPDTACFRWRKLPVRFCG